MRRNSGDRWLIWSDPGAPRRRCRASSNRPPQAIWNWVRQADRDEGRRQDGATSAEREELTRLRRENRRLRQERDILAKAAAWFARETAVIPSGSSNS
jgi:transposase-like protein